MHPTDTTMAENTDDDAVSDVAPPDPAELYSLVATSSGARPQIFSGVRDKARQDLEADVIFNIQRQY